MMAAYLTRLLEHHAAAGTIRVELPDLAATIFMRMVPGGSTRAALTGVPPDMEEVEEMMDYGIKLFLAAIRVR
jgi:hypothetical protein